MMRDGDKGSLDRRIENLSPAQRALLEQRLMQRRVATARKSGIPRREIEGPCQLSFAQELLWLLSQVFDDGIAYNAPAAFQLEGALDLDVLRRAFDGLVNRHEILRTTYSVIDGRPVQIIGPPYEVELNVVDLRGRPADEQNTESQEILKDESRFRFDLVNGPVIRPTIIRLSENSNILMLNMHHVCTDGWSRTILYHDLTAIYEAIVNGRPSPLTPLTIQYADYAVWHREWLERGVEGAQLNYWTKTLARAPSRLDLPTDFPRPPVRSYVGDQISLMLDLATRESLRATARSGDATLFVALLALFAELLHRYSGQDDVVIGTPFAGRNRTELESMVGYFINPLALRVDLSGDPTFSELIARARETTLQGFAHADVPYETVVRKINPERDLSQTPVFQAMIVMHNPAWQTQRPKFEPEGIRCAEITHEKGWSKFDVLMGMSERTNGLNTTWEYSTELFKPHTIERMMEHFRTLAEGAASGGDRRLSQLSMLSNSERAKVLVSWNPRSEPAQEDSIRSLFERQAARQPGATAVVCADERLTFDELNRGANRIAALLARHGVRPGTLVAILMEKSIDLVPAVLGVMKSGGAYVPLDPNYPADRLEFMLADAQPKVLLTHERLLGDLPKTGAVTIAVDVPETLDGCCEENPAATSSGDDLAYVIYTSGSTGKPKGVMITNRSIVSAHFAWESAYRLSELTAHLQMASFSFDVFTGDLVRSLPAGAKLVLCPVEVTVDPPRLYELIVREGVDAAEFVPATASLLFEYAEREGLSLQNIRLLAVASEAWRNEKYDLYKRLTGPGTRLVNSYGLTEATIDSTWFELSAGTELAPGRFVPIGKPFANTRVYIVDANFEPQPVGIPGELCVGGVAVGRGYLNRPELTAERFRPDPFSDEPGARLYRTGDLACWLPDGNIEFMGRTDRQLKIRGFRIEPGEIESALERHAAVRAAAVTERKDEHGDSRLVAYLVPVSSGKSPAPDELRTLVADSLPAYMIPSAWVVVESVPLTPNGKVDLDALPEPEFDRSAATDELVLPRTETERALAVIWTDVLGVQEVGVFDNFFALGGHSLLAVRLFSEIERKLGIRLSLASLFRGATIAELSELIDQDQDADQAWSSIVQMRSGKGEKPLFLVGWAGGEVLGYRELVDSVASEVPIYGLRAPGVDGDVLPLATIEQMAAHYIEEIRTFQPHGPYRIGGYCFAGLVAYEMATQLVDVGEKLELLALIDAYPDGSSRRPSRLEQERVKFRAFMDSGVRGKAAWIRHRARNVKNRVRETAYLASGKLVYDVLASRRLERIPRLPWRLVLITSSRARTMYKPRPANVRIDFFRAQTDHDDRPTPWESLALGGVELRQVVVPEINHESMMHVPHVQVLASELALTLERAATGRLQAARSIAQSESTCSGERRTTARGAASSSGP